MEQIDTYNTTNGYSQPTMTSPISDSNAYEKFEDAGRILYQLSEENKRLQVYESKFEAEVIEKEKYKERYYAKCEECDDVKSENKLLKEEIRLLRLHQGNGAPLSKFQYVFDVMDFNDNVDIPAIERLMDICLELAETKLSRGYLIEESEDIAPLYILLAERNVFRQHGNIVKDQRNWGLTAFCDCWNNNILPRICDERRKDKLYCDSDQIKSALGKAPWKDSASLSWSRLHDAYGNSNGQISRRKKKLARAINIKKRMEVLLEQIPALKSKKY